MAPFGLVQSAGIFLFAEQGKNTELGSRDFSVRKNTRDHKVQAKVERR